ncbi:MAG TPA: tetratricopeptide repeat protein [Terracidiphilus sp.]|nr:tetratricopeptide repeat protein [Terracidiphilus sp.]
MLGPHKYFCLPAALLLARAVSIPAVPAQTTVQASPPALLAPANSASSLNPLSAASAGTAMPLSVAPTPPRALSPELIGDVAAAHQHFRAAIAAYAKAPQMTAVLWDKTGIAYEMLHDFGGAIRCYQEALRLNPDFAEVYNNLGTLYGLARNFAKADRNYRMALKLDPNSPRFLRNLGTNLLAERKFAAGWAAYRQALAIDPGIFDVGGPTVGSAASVHNRGAMYYYIALGCARIGDANCAVENLRAAVDRGFADPKQIAEDERFATLRRNHAFQLFLKEEGSQ